MSFWDLVATLRALVAHPGRALLTLTGIVIGAGAIVLTASLIGGGQDALLRTNQRATDADLVRVERHAAPPRERERTSRGLSQRDAAELGRSRAIDGAGVGSESSRALRAEFAGRHKKVTLVSGNASSEQLYRLELAQGRFIDEDDVRAHGRVAVIGAEVWRELCEETPIAKRPEISVGGELFSVVGVLADKPILGSTTGTNIWDRKVLIPETTYRSVERPDGSVDRIYVRRASGLPLETLRAQVEALLMRRHFGVRDFELDDPAKRSNEKNILAVIRVLLLATGLVALFVGGINVMNVMLVTVSERTREIGIRRAVGASRRAVVFQFLWEAAALSLLGGTLGVVSGAGLAALAALVFERALGHWAFAIEPASVLFALGSSVLVGVCFGLLPALRAARVDPIEALRFE